MTTTRTGTPRVAGLARVQDARAGGGTGVEKSSARLAGAIVAAGEGGRGGVGVASAPRGGADSSLGDSVIQQ